MPHAHVKDALPRLRRHAFILAGDRAKADDSVAECLKAYRRDPRRVRPEAAEIDLFRLFHDTAARGITAGRPGPVPECPVPECPLPECLLPVAAGVVAGDGPHAAPVPGRQPSVPRPIPRPGGPRSGVPRSGVLFRFQALPAAQRQVLTLVSVEGFSIRECAHVLGLPPQRVGTLLAAARRRLAGLPA